jgi:hypothetical protein
MPIEREYWKKADEGVSLQDYPEINDDGVKFPETEYITYAVCSKECGNTEFIVDGSTQICDHCGKSMFRTAVAEYRFVRKVPAEELLNPK